MKLRIALMWRPLAVVSALALILSSAAPTLFGNGVVWADQVVDRSIQMSDSAPSGGTITSGVGSGTAVNYKLKFTTLAAMQNVVVDFCEETPLVGDANCTLPPGLVLGSTLAAAEYDPGTGSSADADWSLTASGNQWTLANIASKPAGTYTFEITGNTNPSNSTGNAAGTTMSFYARITTYTAANAASYVDPSNPGTYEDYGGIALSTTQPILVTARVMETFSLCTSGSDGAGANPLQIASNCAGATTPAVTLGTAPNYVLNTDTASVGNIYTQVSTNAFNGYSLWLRAANAGACLEKTASVCGIPAINGGAAAPSAFVAATAALGAWVSDGVAADPNGTIVATGSNTAVEKWGGGPTNDPTLYLMDTVTADDNVTAVYGSKIAESNSQASSVNNTITFAAIASPTTPAGIYTENFSLIGVGRF